MYRVFASLPFLILCILLPICKLNSQVADLSVFNNLVNKSWKAETNWEKGGKFKQEVSFTYSLDSSLVLVHSKGFIDEEQTEYGDRNFGIRRVNSELDQIEFVEYDVFGGKTEGVVSAEGKNLYYSYVYEHIELTDAWEYLDDSNYIFIVGVRENGEWEKKFLETKFIAQPFE